ncbi:hypothetical protein ACHAPI_006998 [Fusarium lateritium]
MEKAFEGVPTIELVQALCLITLKHLKTRKLNRAWMTAGAASRLEAQRILSYEGSSSLRDHAQIQSYWLVHALECLLVPLTTRAPGVETPEYPDLTLIPPQPHSSQIGDVSSTSAVESDRVAIIAHSLSIITIWGKLKCHLHSLRQGKTEKPWSTDSMHTKINFELINFEATGPKKLFLCNAYLSKRTRDEVSRHPEYWNRFMVSQLMWHATHAILNHPFIHLSVLASSDSIPPSCFFMQQRIDMAIYHSNWTFRLLDMFNNLMDIADPMVSEAMAAKVDTLRKLQALARENYRQGSIQGTTISFHTAWFWDLLAPKPIFETNEIHESDLRGEAKSEINLKNHFVLPLQDGLDSEPGNAAVGLDIDPLLATLGELELFNIDSLTHDFFQSGLWDQI